MVQNVAAIVAAATKSRGIGFEGQLPWKLSADLQHFRKITSSSPSSQRTNAIIMGRKTWDSLPKKPLPGRTNVVLSSAPTMTLPEGVLHATSLENAIEQLQQLPLLGNIFVIGGAQVYQQAIELGIIDTIYYTEIDNLPPDTKFDTFFPMLLQSEWQRDDQDDKENWNTEAATGLQYRFVTYQRHQNTEEQQYLQLCRNIIEQGVVRGDRTGTGTKSIFGAQMRFSLRDGTLPLLTTKRVFWRGVAEELLWFISGTTNANLLREKNIHIWDGNASREFLDARGLPHRAEGDLGPVYGFQWRHFGAEYVDMHHDYTGQGVDQLADCIHKIIHHPEDRRIIMSAWNPKDLDFMALPPCHMFCQFYVNTQTNELSCQMYQRSADMGLGVPFNIASYALLTHMMAQVTGRQPGDFVHVIGDAHVYLNHVEPLQEQLKRRPRAFPKIRINPDKKNIDDFVFEDFEVAGYEPHKLIKMDMAV